MLKSLITLPFTKEKASITKFWRYRDHWEVWDVDVDGYHGEKN